MFIHTMNSGSHYGVTSDGRQVLVVIVKGRAMDVKYFNNKGLFNCTEYNKDGAWQCEWIETKRGEMIWDDFSE